MPGSLWRIASIVVVGLALAESRGSAQEADREDEPATAAFTQRIDRLAKAIQASLAGNGQEPIRARKIANLIAVHAQYGQGGGGKIARATLSEAALHLRKDIDARLDTAGQRAAELPRLKPNPLAHLDKLTTVLDFDELMQQFGNRGVKVGGLSIEQSLQKLVARGGDLHVQDLDDQALDMAHHIAVLGESLIDFKQRFDRKVTFLAHAGDVWQGALDLAAGVEARNLPRTVKALNAVHNACTKCHERFIHEPGNALLATVLDQRQLLRDRTQAAQVLTQHLDKFQARGWSEAKSKGSVLLLIEALKEPDPAFQKAVIEAVHATGFKGDVALVPLRKSLQTADAHLRYWFAYQLRQATTAEQAIAILRDALHHPEARYVALAAELLGALGPDARVALADLIKAAQSPRFAIGPPAVEAVQKVAPGETEPLIALLTKGNALASARAANALGRVGRPAVEPLMKLLQDEDRTIQTAAAFALGKIGRDAREAVPALRELQKSTDPILQLTATQALQKIKPEAGKGKP